MGNIRLATSQEIDKLSRLSVSLGNIPFSPDQCIASVLTGKDDEIAGFAAVQSAWHAAGSWVKEELRRQKHTYALRSCLENEMRRRGIPVYVAIPQTDFQKFLFAKYGLVTEHIAQVRHL